MGNQYLNLAKNTSLGIAVAFPEIVAVGQTLYNQEGQTLPVFIVWMIFYSTVSLTISSIINFYNRNWMRENLFSSIPSSILTVATSFFVLGFFRGLFGFAMASDKDWLSVLNNMQLYMVQAYPEEDFIRVWISVGLALVFAGISIGLWKSTEESSLIYES